MKKLTSFMKLSTGEGDRIAFTYSEIDEGTGQITSQNNKGNFIILDHGVSEHVKAIEEYITENKLGG